MTHFIDTSIFQGTKEFTTPLGTFRMYSGGLYELIADTFIFVGRCEMRASPEKVYADYIARINGDE